MGNARAKSESTSSRTADASSFIAAVRGARGSGASQRSDRSAGTRGWFVGFRAGSTAAPGDACCARGAETGNTASAMISAIVKVRVFVIALRFHLQQRGVAIRERAHELVVKVVGSPEDVRRHALFVQHTRPRDLAAEARDEVTFAPAGHDRGFVIELDLG